MARLLLLLSSACGLRLHHPMPLSLDSPRAPHTLRGSPSMQAQASHSVLVPIGTGSEEIETACITDTLVRAGASVTVASVMPGPSLEVTMSRGLRLVADCAIEDCVGKEWACIALPGGMPGAEHLRDSSALRELLSVQRDTGQLTAALCASPAVVLASHGLCPVRATCYPAPQFCDTLPSDWVDSKVELDNNVITSQGPGTSLQFALKIVEQLYGREKAELIAKQMLTTLAA